MTALAILFAGFSIFCAVSLTFSHFRCEHYRDQPFSRAMGLLLLLALSGLQLAHFAWLYRDLPWFAGPLYRGGLFVVAPAFFLFSRPLLQPARPPANGLWLPVHALPAAIGLWLPVDVALPLSFCIGAGYLLWLAHCLYGLRHERARFPLEMGLLGGVFVIAIVVTLLSLVQTALPEKWFFSLYTMAVGAAFLLVQTALGRRPQLAAEVSEAARAAYANSTLNNVDCAAVLSQLETLVRDERIHLDAELSLPGLAQRLGLTPHQLSELMNARLGKGFSRYLRELRIEAAKAMLRDEPSVSVLAVGLNVGFTSQSNFYEAFRDIEGMTPGQYRKVHGRAAVIT
jgi:AraC-like DNA-binding protein